VIDGCACVSKRPHHGAVGASGRRARDVTRARHRRQSITSRSEAPIGHTHRVCRGVHVCSRCIDAETLAHRHTYNIPSHPITRKYRIAMERAREYDMLIPPPACLLVRADAHVADRLGGPCTGSACFPPSAFELRLGKWRRVV
jgi:hypothetical protein